MGYYIEQVEGAYKKSWDKAKETIDGPINTFYNTFKSIIEENEFSSKAEERWKGMNEKIKTLSTELKTNIENKYSEMTKEAEKFQKWYDDLSSLVGDAGGTAGLEFAQKNGFEPWHGTRPIKLALQTDDRSPSNPKKKIMVWKWTAFSSVNIGEDGYTNVTMHRHEIEINYYLDDTTSIDHESDLGTKTVPIRTQEDYDKYYTGRGGSIF